MALPVLGIDLGTTNSVVAVADTENVHVLPDEEGRLLTPSAVSFHPSGDVLVGAAAVERKLVDAPNTVASIKRLIGRPFRSPEVRRAAERFAFELASGKNGGVVVCARAEQYSLPEISAFVLRRLKAIAERALQVSSSSAVVTVPANFNELQRTATRDAARIAGLNVLRILNEPTAAALAYGYGSRSRKRIAVYDLGGGTFDISILDMSGDVIEVVATAGDTYLGGDDVDNAIADEIAQRFLREHRIDLREDPQGYERLRLAAEWLKCELSTRFVADATLEELAFDRRGQPINYTFDLMRDKLQQLAFPLIGRTFDICEEAMQVAGLRPSQLDGVVLVGGQTRSPQVREMVAEYFGCDPQVNVDPDQVVAEGAALQAMALSARRPGSHVALGRPAVSSAVQPSKPSPKSAAVQASFFATDPPPSPDTEDEPTRIESRETVEARAAAVAAPAAAPRPPAPRPPPPPVGAPPPPAGAAPVSAVAPPAFAGEDEPLAHLTRGAAPTLSGIGRPGRDDTEVTRLEHDSLPPDPDMGALELPSAAPSRPPATAEASAGTSRRASRRNVSTTARPPAMVPTGAAASLQTAASAVALSGAEAAEMAAQPATSPLSVEEQDEDEDELPAALRSPDYDDVPGFERIEVPDATVPFEVRISTGPPPPGSAVPPESGAAPLSPGVPSLLSSHARAQSSSPPARRSTDAPAKQRKPRRRARERPASGPQSSAPSPAPRTPIPEGIEVPVAVTSAPAPRASMQAPPLLLDVTPRALAIETAGGFCEQIVQRNSPIPTEQSRVFSTSQDRQVQVSMRVCQGEGRRMDDNEVLGELELLGLREAPRGQVRIGVTFVIDADGMLRVRAQDRTTGKSQEIRINLVGALADDEVERMRKRQEAMLAQSR